MRETQDRDKIVPGYYWTLHEPENHAYKSYKALKKALSVGAIIVTGVLILAGRGNDNTTQQDLAERVRNSHTIKVVMQPDQMVTYGAYEGFPDKFAMFEALYNANAGNINIRNNGIIDAPLVSGPIIWPDLNGDGYVGNKEHHLEQ